MKQPYYLKNYLALNENLKSNPNITEKDRIGLMVGSHNYENFLNTGYIEYQLFKVELKLPIQS